MTPSYSVNQPYMPYNSQPINMTPQPNIPYGCNMAYTPMPNPNYNYGYF